MNIINADNTVVAIGNKKYNLRGESQKILLATLLSVC